MDEWTQPNIEDARDLLRQDQLSMPSEIRRGLAAAIADAMLCQDSAANEVFAELIDLLAKDPDWGVRLEVAKMVHLLDDDACGRMVALFRCDCNSYVRSHAERSLARQRRARQTSNRKHSDCRSYSDRIDQLARQYGIVVARKVQALADQRYALLAAAVAHDVRSIMTTLSANAAVLAEEHGATGRFASILEDIGFLKRTIEAMEQFSKPVPVQRLPENVHQIIQQAIEKARECVARQGHDLSAVDVVVAPAPDVRPRVSRRLIVLALTNVIQNALECFSSRDVDALRPGRIDVQAIVDGYETRILVKDNGPGIEPEVLKELATFVPTGLNKAKRCSSGWGLSLVHKYVTAHRGTVTIGSEMDQGTTVVISLPMRDFVEGDDE